MPATKPVFVTERNLRKFIESIADNRQKKPENSDDNDTGIVTLLFLGNKRQFYDLLPTNWLSTLPDSMTEEFTDNFHIYFISTIKELQVKLYDLQQRHQPCSSDLSNFSERTCSSFLIIWGLVTYLEETKYAFFNPIYTVQSIDNILYAMFSLLNVNAHVIFGESLLNVRDPEDKRLLLNLLPGPVEPGAAPAPRASIRCNSDSAAGAESEPGLTGNAVRGSSKDRIRVSEVLDRWFLWDDQ
jgi:hypothetical protein